MIDYIKLKIDSCDVKLLLENSNLEFRRTVSEKTGLLDNKTICEYHHCKITIYDCNVVIFQGSIHKLHNSITGIEAPNKKSQINYKGFNGNQFNYTQIDFTRNHLANLFNVPTNQMILQNVEYGQNLTTSFDPQTFITGLLMYMGKAFDYNYNGYYAQSKHSQYIIKVYNKGNQYNMQFNTLRLEIKVTKMQCQKKEIGLSTMADITTETLDKAFKFLFKILNKVLYYDNSIIKTNLSKIDKARIKDYSNPRYWTKLKPSKRDTKKKLLSNIIRNNSDNLKEQLLEQLENNRVTFYQLLEIAPEVILYTSNIGESNTLKDYMKHTIIEPDSINQKRPRL
ncbi:MAG: hypothetical protein ACSHWW_14135 [Nonlabens sp.]|uniref:hypothetical protein n=1 Tax=Nonlabens sp. TaxID=1888209 RepID=UPI003EF30F2A